MNEKNEKAAVPICIAVTNVDLQNLFVYLQYVWAGRVEINEH